ncbi:hypothetical protein QBC37DRAFT_430328 [Rhypophila decipiens]|uniref:EF-hand domain-containing protein n=1 Tax=Rhypophila decipiens TaxID=261697 RepID=A0AAN6XYX7_9PEZI|nr:hypothetical protein QBC37DRAFT_430328 [Rhypophila decipiens]
MASEADIRKAFKGGDDDGDDTLSVSEAINAVEKLSGRSLDEEVIKSACDKSGVPTSREMDCELVLLAPPRLA